MNVHDQQPVRQQGARYRLTTPSLPLVGISAQYTGIASPEGRWPTELWCCALSIESPLF